MLFRVAFWPSLFLLNRAQFCDIKVSVPTRKMFPPTSVAETQPQLVRILIADNRPIFRDGLRQLLQTEPRLLIVGETSTSAAMAVVVEVCPDILLMDFSPPEVFNTLAAVADAASGVRSIVLAESVDGSELTKALHAGARGVVLKDSAADVLFRCIHAVLDDQYWIVSDAAPDAPSSLRKLESELRRRRAFGLTPRELEIVRKVVGGCSNKEIAEQLAIGENTVKSHLTHIFNKLGASSRIELALFAAHHRLLD
jgi:DNA-binding NarL/FixJ family response regulator